jgi:hypothetical protein
MQSPAFKFLQRVETCFYAMLALTAIGGGEKAVGIAWRWRALLDLGIASIAVFIGRSHWF